MCAADQDAPAKGAPRVLYRYGRSNIDSRIPLTVLPDAEAGGRAHVSIDYGAQPCPEDTYWHHHWLDGDEVVLSLAGRGPNYWLRFPELADFYLQTEEGRILLAPDATADADTLEHLLVDQLLPRLLAQGEHLLVHASAVTIAERHVLFLGPSGWGKSTLAGLLERQGHAVHSDDCVQLQRGGDRYEALPTYPSLRLYPDSLDALFAKTPSTARVASYTEKKRIAIESAKGIHAPVVVDAIYVLGDPDEADDTVHITPLRTSQTCQVLIRHSFRLDLKDREATAVHFARCAELANRVPAFALDYPRDFSRTAALVQALTRHVAGLPAPT